MKERNTPNLFLVGAPRCGTSALVSYLSQHKCILFSDPKEPSFFCSDIKNIGAVSHVRNWDDYLHLYETKSTDVKYFGDGSTLYLYSKVAIQQILCHLPESKIIIMTRDPTDLAVSFHKHMVQIGHETVNDFGEAWKLQKDRSAGLFIPRNCLVPELLQYQSIAALGSQLKRLLKRVPQGQRLIIPYSAFFDDPLKVYKTVLNFLKLDYDDLDVFPFVNKKGRPRSVRIVNLLKSKRMRIVAQRLKRSTPNTFSRMAAQMQERVLYNREGVTTVVTNEARGIAAEELEEERVLLEALLSE